MQLGQIRLHLCELAELLAQCTHLFDIYNLSLDVLSSPLSHLFEFAPTAPSLDSGMLSSCHLLLVLIDLCDESRFLDLGQLATANKLPLLNNIVIINVIKRDIMSDLNSVSQHIVKGFLIGITTTNIIIKVIVL